MAQEASLAVREPAPDAVRVWDALWEKGKAFDVHAANRSYRQKRCELRGPSLADDPLHQLVGTRGVGQGIEGAEPYGLVVHNYDLLVNYPTCIDDDANSF